MTPKVIAFGISCFGLGAVVGWAVTRYRVDKKVKDTDESVEAMSTLLRKRTIQLATVQSELDEATRDADIFDGQNDDEEVPEDETIDETREKLQSLISEYTGNPDEGASFAERAVRSMEPDYTPPFVISREKYAWDEEEGDEYDKITLTYFPKSRVLLDDDKDPIDDVDSTIGWKSLNQFGGESGDPDVVFVRNRRMLVDYEVVREDDDELPLHVKYGMSHDEFATNEAAGLIRFREGDM